MIRFFIKYLFFIFSFILFNRGVAATYYSKATGNWGNAATWGTACGTGTGAVPTAADDVIICTGHTITMNVNGAQCNSITLAGGTMSWSNARTTTTGTFTLQGGTITGSQTGILNVTGNMNATSGTTGIGRCDLTVSGTSTINSGVFVNISSATGTKNFGSLVIAGTFNNVANSAITISGNLQNDGAYTVGSGQVTFTGASNNTITGTQTTDFTSININKGTSNANVLDVQSLITLTAGGLTLTNGTFELTNSSIAISPFTADVTAAPYRIPSTAGLWCNGATINSGNINWTVAGLLRISSGTVNLGNTANNNFRAENSGTAQLTVEGGTFNVAGNITKAAAGDYLSFNMSGGTIVVPTVGSSVAGVSPFQMNEASGSFTMSNGTIIIERAGAGNLGFTGTAGTANITGGTLQIGDASTPASQTIIVNTGYSIANLSLNSSNATAQLGANLSVLQSITISSGTLNANNLNITLGNSWTNSGTWTPGTGTITFNGTGTQTITKSGGETFNNVTINKSTGTVTLANNINVDNILTMTSGNIDCGSNTITLGTSTVSTGTLTYTAGTIIGSFKRWINTTGVGILFPIGTSAYYRPALLTFTGLTGGTLTINFVSANPGSLGLPLSESGKSIVNQYTEGYWNLVAADALSSADYAIELTGNGFTSYSVSPSTRLIYRTSSGSPWTLNGTHSDAIGNIAKRTAVSGISTAQFGFGKPACSAFATTSVTTLTADPICASQLDVDYSVNASDPLNTYTWSLPLGGGTIDPPGTGASITVDWGGTGGQYTVRVTETNDCGDNNTPVDRSVTVHPIATSAITGSTSVATNELNVAYSVTNIVGYSYSWSLPSGGGAIDAPGTGNAVTIDWGATPGTYSVRVDATRSCGAPDFQTLTVTVRGPIISTATGGNWTLGGTWIGGVAPTSADYVEIAGGATVTINNSAAACYKLTIKGNANWTAVRTLTVGNGGVVITTGNITGTGAGTLISTGGLTGTSNSPIQSSTVNIILQTTAGQMITSDGALNLLQIDATTTNTGTLTIGNGGTLSGSSTLTQAASSTLTMNGSTFTLTSLDASATGNTVVYGASANQTVRSSTYNNLTFSGTGTKTLGGAITVNGNLNITGVTLDAASPGNFPITLAGNWANTGTFTPRGGTVTFNGSSTQTVTNTAGETFNNLVFSGAGTKQLNNNVTINFDFTNSSTFDAGANNINIKGNWDNSGSYSSTNDVTFSNSTTISGPSATTFNNVIITGTLTGHLTNFNVTGNWTNNGTFNNNTGKVTFSGTTAISGASTNSFANVDITGTLTAPAGNMNISKNFNNSGTFNHNNGTLTFNGAVAQTIQGANTFYNLTINNTVGGVAVTSGAQNLISTLTLTNGAFNTNNALTLVSNASATARIAAITGGSITGNITQQRHIASASTSWRQIGSAVSGQTLANWYDNFAMCGFTGVPGCGGTGITNSVYSYDETQAGVKEIGWAGATDIINTIGVGQGFMVMIGNAGANIDMNVTGTTNTGSISLPVTWTNTGSPANDGWNLVANPYPSNIDWELINPSTTNISATISIWNPSSQNYAQYTAGGPDPGPNGGRPFINSTQAFWVQATGAPVITLTETMKTATAPTFFKLGGEPDVLKLKIESSNGYSDETFIQFKVNGNAQYDNADGNKFFSGYDVPHIVSVIEDSFKVGLNTMPELTSNVTIPLHAGGKATVSIGGGIYVCNKTFTISAVQLVGIIMSSCIILEDTKTGTLTDLRDTSYTFTVSDTANSYNAFAPALSTSPRFFIHIGSGLEKSSAAATCYDFNDGMAIAKGKGTGPWNYLWKDESNSVVRVISKNTADTLKNIGAGIYTIEISGNNGYCATLKDTIVINEPAATISIISDVTGISCNGASDGEVNLFVSGDYPPFIFSWNNDSTLSHISHLTSQIYTVTISDSTGCSVTKNFNVHQPDVLSSSFTNSDTVYLSDGGYAYFLNTSMGSDLSVWDFGDGSAPDSSDSPTHQYAATGTYTVSLISYSENCGENDNSIGQITVAQINPNVGINAAENFKPEIKVMNGSNGTTVFIDFKKFTNANVSLYNSLGQTIYTSHISHLTSHISINQPTGIYFLNISSEQNSYRYKVEVIK